MVDHFDELVLLLLRSDGKNAAVTAYEEESGVSHAEAVQAVEVLAQKHDFDPRKRSTKRLVAIAATLLTSAILGFMILVR
jgi:hypothetical protein